MSFDAYALVTLKASPERGFVVLSYPGMETNGTIVIAPLVSPGDIAIVETLHPIVETSLGPKVVVVERLAAILPELVELARETLIEFEYPIQRALSRLFFGN